MPGCLSWKNPKPAHWPSRVRSLQSGVKNHCFLIGRKKSEKGGGEGGKVDGNLGSARRRGTYAKRLQVTPGSGPQDLTCLSKMVLVNSMIASLVRKFTRMQLPRKSISVQA